jgi:hypothetical protein
MFAESEISLSQKGRSEILLILLEGMAKGESKGREIYALSKGQDIVKEKKVEEGEK